MDSFSNKVSFVNKQKQLLVVKCPPLNLNTTSTSASTNRSLSSASSSRSRVSTAQSSMSISGDLLNKRTRKGGRDTHLVRAHSKIYDQLKSHTASQNKSGSGMSSGTGPKKPSYFSNFTDESSLLSDVTGGGAYSSDLSSMASMEVMKEKREQLLSQCVFADTGGQDNHQDLEMNAVEVRLCWVLVCCSPDTFFVV